MRCRLSARGRLQLLQTRLQRRAQVGPSRELVFEPERDLPDVLRLQQHVDLLFGCLDGDVAQVRVVWVVRQASVRFLQRLEGLSGLE